MDNSRYAFSRRVAQVILVIIWIAAIAGSVVGFIAAMRNPAAGGPFMGVVMAAGFFAAASLSHLFVALVIAVFDIADAQADSLHNIKRLVHFSDPNRKI